MDRLNKECIHGGRVGSCPICEIVVDRDCWREKADELREIAIKLYEAFKYLNDTPYYYADKDFSDLISKAEKLLAQK